MSATEDVLVHECLDAIPILCPRGQSAEVRSECSSGRCSGLTRARPDVVGPESHRVRSVRRSPSYTSEENHGAAE